MFIISPAAVNEMEIIHSLAHSIWPVVYKNMISSAQIDYMLNMMYSQASLVDQVKKEKHEFFIAREHDEPIAFAAIYPKNKSSNQLFRLDKLYVNSSLHGKGIGKKMIDHIITIIKPIGASVLELNVNRNNKAVTFYKKLGFVITQEVDIDIGGGFFMNDYVMQKNLTSFPPLP